MGKQILCLNGGGLSARPAANGLPAMPSTFAACMAYLHANFAAYTVAYGAGGSTYITAKPRQIATLVAICNAQGAACALQLPGQLPGQPQQWQAFM